MRKSRFTEEQIIGFIKQAEAGLPIKDLCRKGGFSDATFYKWRAKYGGMDVPDARRLHELEYGIDRERQDAYAVESHRRAAEAIEQGRFKSQIIGVEIKTRKGVQVFDTDEHVRPGTTTADLAKLKPVFRAGGTVTAGNSSGINDGAAAVILASGQEVDRRRLQPIGRLIAWGLAGVPPEIMGVGPVHAVPVALQRAGLELAANRADLLPHLGLRHPGGFGAFFSP